MKDFINLKEKFAKLTLNRNCQNGSRCESISLNKVIQSRSESGLLRTIYDSFK